MARKLNPSIFTTLDPVKDDNELIFGSGSDGFIYQMEVGTSDDGDPIESRWVTPWFDMGRPEVMKAFRYLHIHVDQYANPITVSWVVDHGTATGSMTLTLPGSGTWGSPGVWGPAPGFIPGVWGPTSIGKQRLVASFPQDAKGQAIQLTITTTDTGDLWSISNVSIFFRVEDALAVAGNI